MKTESIQLAKFDYAGLDRQTRIVVEQRTTEIRDRMGRAAQNVVEIGERLLAVKAELGHGNFGHWLQSEFGWEVKTAQRMMNVANVFKNDNLSNLQIAPSALYLLANDSTPETVRDGFIEQAKSGKPVTHAEVKKAVAVTATRKPQVERAVESEKVIVNTTTGEVIEDAEVVTTTTTTTITKPAPAAPPVEQNVQTSGLPLMKAIARFDALLANNSPNLPDLRGAWRELKQAAGWR